MRSTMNKVTPLLAVDRIEKCLPFWVKVLGFKKVAEVPHNKTIGFVILVKDGLEVMLQSRASLKKDVPPVEKVAGKAALYVTVKDILAIQKKVSKAKDVKILVPLRTTFYGAREIFVREPGGNVLGFAQHG